MSVYELNIDGLVGPTHHYAGLSDGNLASLKHAFNYANPAAAARQGIEKMRLLHQLGIKQAVFPPHQRPNLHLLHQLGFHGTPAEQVSLTQRSDKALLSACYSASSMWTANAATISPSTDTADERVHFTAANLVSHLHRHQEAHFTHQVIKQLFSDERYFQHHPTLPNSVSTGDEGAANHSRICATHLSKGVHVFVYGKEGLHTNTAYPKRYPARQTLEASQIIARNHQLNPHYVLFAQQNPDAIDQGVFHNDVIAVANESLLLIHEDALLNQKAVLNQLIKKAAFQLNIIEVNRRQVPIKDAIDTYLFNSQLVTLPDSTMALIAPTECQKNVSTKQFIDELLTSNQNPINQVFYLDLKQSMKNGGGPACLRLRVPLNQQELSAMHQGILITDNLLDSLDKWVLKHYRTQLHANDLADPALINEAFTALDELTTLLNLGQSFYPFQTNQS